MSILDTKEKAFRYFIASFITLCFAFIYELFSHNVYSSYMIFAFLIPLISSIICFIIYKLKFKFYSKESDNLLFASTITLTLGSLMKGVLDIYGTTNSLINIYLYTSIILYLSYIISFIINLVKKY